MAMTRMTFEAWGEALAAAHGKPDYARFMGVSPGGAATELKCTRQRIWQLCKEGKLDMLMLSDTPEAKVSTWLISEASIERVRRGKPMHQTDLLFGKPRTIVGTVKRYRRLAQVSRTRAK